MTGDRRTLLIAAGAVLLVLAAALLLWWSRRPAPTTAADGGDPAATGEELTLAVDLYFPGNGTLLRVERRELVVADQPEAQLLAIARALLAGPETPSLRPPMPSGVTVRSVHLGDAGVAYVDLVSDDGGPPPPSGSTEELLRVYSLVNTLVLNVAEARSTALLWNGEQPETLSGHLDLTRPLRPDPALVAAGGGGDTGR